jgi:hypothetical protein
MQGALRKMNETNNGIRRIFLKYGGNIKRKVGAIYVIQNFPCTSPSYVCFASKTH